MERPRFPDSARRILRRMAMLAYLRLCPMPENLPERLVQEPADGPPRAALIWLHGMGANARKFLKNIPPPKSPNLRVVALQAPVRPIAILNGCRLPAWANSLPNGRLPFLSDLDQMEESALRVRGEVARQRRDGIAQVAIGGHSQGGFLALYTALTHPEPMAAVISLSGFLPAEAQTQLQERGGQLTLSSPIFLGHGTRDTVFRFKQVESSRDWLLRHGAEVHWHSGTYGHVKRGADEIEACEKFLNAHLG